MSDSAENPPARKKQKVTSNESSLFSTFIAPFIGGLICGVGLTVFFFENIKSIWFKEVKKIETDLPPPRLDLNAHGVGKCLDLQNVINFCSNLAQIKSPDQAGQHIATWFDVEPNAAASHLLFSKITAFEKTVANDITSLLSDVALTKKLASLSFTGQPKMLNIAWTINPNQTPASLNENGVHKFTENMFHTMFAYNQPIISAAFETTFKEANKTQLEFGKFAQENNVTDANMKLALKELEKYQAIEPELSKVILYKTHYEKTAETLAALEKQSVERQKKEDAIAAIAAAEKAEKARLDTLAAAEKARLDALTAAEKTRSATNVKPKLPTADQIAKQEKEKLDKEKLEKDKQDKEKIATITATLNRLLDYFTIWNAPAGVATLQNNVENGLLFTDFYTKLAALQTNLSALFTPPIKLRVVEDFFAHNSVDKIRKDYRFTDAFTVAIERATLSDAATIIKNTTDVNAITQTGSLGTLFDATSQLNKTIVNDLRLNKKLTDFASLNINTALVALCEELSKSIAQLFVTNPPIGGFSIFQTPILEQVKALIFKERDNNNKLLQDCKDHAALLEIEKTKLANTTQLINATTSLVRIIQQLSIVSQRNTSTNARAFSTFFNNLQTLAVDALVLSRADRIKIIAWLKEFQHPLLTPETAQDAVKFQYEDQMIDDKEVPLVDFIGFVFTKWSALREANLL